MGLAAYDLYIVYCSVPENCSCAGMVYVSLSIGIVMVLSITQFSLSTYFRDRKMIINNYIIVIILLLL